MKTELSDIYKKLLDEGIPKILEDDELQFSSDIPYGVLKQYLESIGFEDNDELETNGWQVDYWNTFSKEDITLSVSGSMYYGNVNINQKEDE